MATTTTLAPIQRAVLVPASARGTVYRFNAVTLAQLSEAGLIDPAHTCGPLQGACRRYTFPGDEGDVRLTRRADGTVNALFRGMRVPRRDAAVASFLASILCA